VLGERCAFVGESLDVGEQEAEAVLELLLAGFLGLHLALQLEREAVARRVAHHVQDAAAPIVCERRETKTVHAPSSSNRRQACKASLIKAVNVFVFKPCEATGFGPNASLAGLNPT